MKTGFIPLEKTNAFSKMVCDYVTGKAYRKLYKYDYSINSFKHVIADKKFSPLQRKTLVEALHKQYSEAGITSSVTENINYLLKENTFTITTGHQLSLFTGPLYFIYKILSTIKLAAELKKNYTEFNFVPVFWMASEDHDFEEIKSIYLFGKEIRWDKSFSIATGRIPLNGFRNILNQFAEVTGNDSDAKRLINSLLCACYDENINLATATRKLVHSLFGKYGLIIVDGDDAALKKQFIPVMEDELNHQTSYTLVTETNKKLEEKEYTVQVKPREVNLFYLGKNFRERIIVQNDIAEIVNQDISFNVAEMIRLMRNNPQDFSPNVILRPLYQETVLPNLAYIGGPAEINYWLQLKTLFDYHKINFPVPVLRNSLMLLDSGMVNKLMKLGFSYEDLFMPADELIKKYMHNKSGGNISFSDFENEFDTLFDKVRDKAEKIDTTLKPTVEAEKHKTKAALKNIEHKIIKAQKQNEDSSINQIRKLKEKLFPNGMLQERHDNIFQYITTGDFALTDSLYNVMQPLPDKFIVAEI